MRGDDTIRSPIYFSAKDKIPSQDNNETARNHLNGIVDAREGWDTYSFAGVNIPRVSQLLDTCIGKPWLRNYAAGLGKRYYSENKKTLYIGTLVHEMIEEFLLDGTIKEFQFQSYDVKTRTERAFNNFLNWYNDKIKLGFEITPLQIEKVTTNPWFGGTIDCKMQMKYKGIVRTYIMDFKTSKSLSFDYLLQAYAYYWSENWNMKYLDQYQNSIPLDGIGIIRVDKQKEEYEDLILDFNDPNNLLFLGDLDTALGSIVNWFYHQQNMNYNLKNMRDHRKEGFVNGTI